MRIIHIRAYDEDGGYDATALTITINNLLPVPTISGDATVNEGSPYTLNLSATDPGQDPIAKWVINWGDGNTETLWGNPSSASHVYVQHGSQTIQATAYDVDDTYNGATVSNSVTVADVPPTLNILAPVTITDPATQTQVPSFNTRDYFVLHLSATDPGGDQITKWEVNWGDNYTDTIMVATLGEAQTAKHLYSPANSATQYTVTVSAFEDTTQVQTATTTAIKDSNPSQGVYHVLVSAVDATQNIFVRPEYEGLSMFETLECLPLINGSPEGAMCEYLTATVGGIARDYEFPQDAGSDGPFFLDHEYNEDNKGYTGTITFQDPDDPDPTHVAHWEVYFVSPVISIGWVDVNGQMVEGNQAPARLQARIWHPAAASEAVTVKLKFAGEAKNGEDYGLADSITIPAGEYGASIPLTIIDDQVPEFDEDFTVSIAEGQPFRTQGGAATMTILDNDLKLIVPKGILLADFDDDNKNNMPDYFDRFFKPHDDLYTVNLTGPAARPGKSVTLWAPSSRVRIWTKEGGLLIGPEKAQGQRDSYRWTNAAVPDTVYMQVIAGSRWENDIDLWLDADGNLETPIALKTAVGAKLMWENFSRRPGGYGSFHAGDEVSAVLVGERMWPLVEVEAPAAWKASSEYYWQISGNAIKGFEIASGFSKGEVIPLKYRGIGGLFRRSVALIWATISGDLAEKSSRETVTINVWLSNGQKLTASTHVPVFRPDVSANALVGLAGFSADGSSIGLQPGPNTGGVGFRATGQCRAPGFPMGEWGFFQLVNGVTHFTEGGSTYYIKGNDMWGLDNECPYMQHHFPADSQAHGINDNPSVSGGQGPWAKTTAARNKNDFKTWVMFRPTGGDWVPLLSKTWGFDVSIKKVDGSMVYDGTPTQYGTGPFEPESKHPVWTLRHPSPNDKYEKR